MKRYGKIFKETKQLKGSDRAIGKLITDKDVKKEWYQLFTDFRDSATQNPKLFLKVGNEFLQDNLIPVKLINVISQNDDTGLITWTVELLPKIKFEKPKGKETQLTDEDIEKLIKNKSLQKEWYELFMDYRSIKPVEFLKIGNKFLMKNNIPIYLTKVISQDEDGKITWLGIKNNKIKRK